MPNDIMDLNARMAVAENELKSLKSSIEDLGDDYDMNTATINEIKITLVKHTAENENLIHRLSDSVNSLHTVNDKILGKLDSFDHKLNTQKAATNKLSLKTKIIWGVMIFIASSVGSMIFATIEKSLNR